MFRAIKRIWTAYRARLRAREAARRREFVSRVIADCYDPRRQAERLARVEAVLSL